MQQSVRAQDQEDLAPNAETPRSASEAATSATARVDSSVTDRSVTLPGIARTREFVDDPGVRRPTAFERAQLRGFERVAFAIAELCNAPPLKAVGQAFLATVGRTWVRVLSQNLHRKRGLEHLPQSAPDRGVMLVANHSSFFDLYVVSSILFHEVDWIKELYFPVRSDFFYDRPLGVFVNGIMAAQSMYPPVLRQKERRLFNRFAIEFVIDALTKPGTVVGYHPEGTRNKTGDPYTMLKAQPGVGEIAYHSRPLIIPVFITGLGNDLPRQVRSNFDGTGTPIDVVFGKSPDLQRLYERPAGPETYQAIADAMRDEIMRLGEIQRAAPSLRVAS